MQRHASCHTQSSDVQHPAVTLLLPCCLRRLEALFAPPSSVSSQSIYAVSILPLVLTMRFARRLHSIQDPRWEDAYIDYVQLKEQLKSHNAEDKESSRLSPTRQQHHHLTLAYSHLDIATKHRGVRRIVSSTAISNCHRHNRKSDEQFYCFAHCI